MRIRWKKEVAVPLLVGLYPVYCAALFFGALWTAPNGEARRCEVLGAMLTPLESFTRFMTGVQTPPAELPGYCPPR